VTARISAGCRFRCAKPASLSLLPREVDGIFIAEFEQGDIGDVLFRVSL
jgi:hypothetical protein